MPLDPLTPLLFGFLHKIGRSAAGKILDIEDDNALDEPGAIVGALLGGTMKDKGKEVLKALTGTAKSYKIPVNQDLLKTVRKSHLLAAKSAAKFCLGNSLYDNKTEKIALKAILHYLGREIQLAGAQKYIPATPDPIMEHLEWLDIRETHKEIVTDGQLKLKADLEATIIYECKAHLFSAGTDNPLVPKCFTEIITNGWWEKEQEFTLFSLMCAYFHQFLKLDPRLSDLVQNKWMAALVEGHADTALEMNANFKALETRLTQIAGTLLNTQGLVNEIIAYIYEQPTLIYDYSSYIDEHRETILSSTVFRSRYSAIYGRDGELTRLLQFIRNKAEFAWCMCSGPAGIGKSRLAMELCFEMDQTQNIHAGFLSSVLLAGFNWNQWKPLATTLLIVDYPEDAEFRDLQEFLAQLKARSHQFTFPVRVLLLTRENGRKSAFRENLDYAITSLKIPRPAMDALELLPITIDDQVNILKDIFQLHNADIPITPEIEDLLSSSGFRGSPLFSIFLAFYLLHHQQVTEINMPQLLDFYLQREEMNFWRKHIPNPDEILQYKNLIAYATITSSITQAAVSQLIAKQNPLFPPSARSATLRSIFNTFSDGSGEGLTYKALEPDILGEYFVLKQLAANETESPDSAQDLVDIGWQTNVRGTVGFIRRALFSFPDNDYMPVLLAVPHPGAPKERKLAWASLTVDAARVPAVNTGPHDIYYYFNIVRDYYHDDQETFTWVLCQLINNLIVREDEPKLLGMLLEEVNEVISAKRSNTSLRYIHAVCIDNFLSRMLEPGCRYLPLCEKALADIEEYFTAAPDSFDWVYAQSLQRFAGYHGQTGYITAAEEYFAKLLDLYEKAPGNYHYFEQTVNAVVNLTCDLTKDSQFERANRVYEEFFGGRWENKEEPFVFGAKMVVFQNNIGIYSDFGDYEKCISLYRQMLANYSVPRPAAALITLYNASYNLLKTYISLNDTRQVLVMKNTLTDLYYSDIPKRREQHEVYLGVHTDLITYLCNIGAPEEAIQCYDEINQLSLRGYPELKIEFLAKALFNLITSLINLDDMTGARKYMDVFQENVSGKTQTEAAIFAYAQALFNMGEIAVRNEAWQEVFNWERELQMACQKYRLVGCYIELSKIRAKIIGGLLLRGALKPALVYLWNLETMLEYGIEAIGIRMAKSAFNILSSLRLRRMKPSSYQRFFNQKFRNNLVYFNNPESMLYYEMALATVLSRLYHPITSAPKDDLLEFTELYHKYRNSLQWSHEAFASLLDDVAIQLW